MAGQTSYSKRRQDRRGATQSDSVDLLDKVVFINRVAKVVKGGRRFSFSAVVVVGDEKGRVGFALGKAREIAEAIRKGTEKAKKAMVKVNLNNATIPHPIFVKFRGCRIVLKPAAEGTGVIAGGPVRAVMEAVGVKNILTKSLGSNNPLNVVTATINGLTKCRDLRTVARNRGKTVGELLR